MNLMMCFDLGTVFLEVDDVLKKPGALTIYGYGHTCVIQAAVL